MSLGIGWTQEQCTKGMGSESTDPREGASSHKIVKVRSDLARNFAPAELPGVRRLRQCSWSGPEPGRKGECWWSHALSHALSHAQRGTLPARRREIVQ